MPAYYFFARRPDGVSVTMDVNELPSDVEAQVHADTMLAWNETAVEVEIWRDRTRLGAQMRQTAAAAPAG